MASKRSPARRRSHPQLALGPLLNASSGFRGRSAKLLCQLSPERRIFHATCGLAAPDPLTVLCYVYRSRRREGAYLYLRDRDDFSVVPDSLMQVFGRPELAFELELTPQRRLASEEPKQVIANLQGRGFHLQMPPANARPT